MCTSGPCFVINGMPFLSFMMTLFFTVAAPSYDSGFYNNKWCVDAWPPDTESLNKCSLWASF